MEDRDDKRTSDRADWKPQAHSPRTLAAEWGCTEYHVRKLIRIGELKAFRLGGKLLRIRVEDVREYECRSGFRYSSGSLENRGGRVAICGG
jgi:excisionase family DNA binding protein